MTVAFELRCPREQLSEYAARYTYPNEAEAEQAGISARVRGYYTKSEFVLLRRWKSVRGAKLAEAAPSSLVEEATRVALSATSEELRLGALMAVPAVGVPTASVLLHFAHSDPYPIIDFRALWTLSVPAPSWYPLEFWLEYVAYCRQLQLETDLSMRELDRALWQYSKEHQPAN